MAKPSPLPAKAHSAPTTHKNRTTWFYERAAFPNRDAPPLELEKFWARQRVLDPHAAHQWRPVGPFNFAGRVTSLVVHPKNPRRIFAGSAAGGVWTSDDRGKTWTSAWGRFVNQNIGALVFHDFFGILHLFAATGEANLSPDSYPGSGVYQSLDEGLTWSRAFGPGPGGKRTSLKSSVETFPRRIGAIVFDRNGRIAVASVTHSDRMPAGLYMANRGGAGFDPVLAWGRRSYNCYSVLFHPENPDIIYTSIEPRGSPNGIWRSQDGGETWQQLTEGLLPGQDFGRTTLAMAPSDPDVLYALAANRSGGLLGIFRTFDGGDTWRETGHGRFPRERFMSYNNAIAVHPRKPDFVVWGGMKLHRSRDAGHHWARITQNADPSKRDYVHDDHHAIVMPGGGWIYSGNDGGVAVSGDFGETWESRSAGMVSTMFYSLGVAPSDSSVFGGGTQDSGTLIATPGSEAGEFTSALPGDGAAIAFDPTDGRHVFGSATDFFVYRHPPRAPWTFDGWKLVMPRSMSQGERSQRAFAVLAIDPTATTGVKRLWGATNRLWVTENNGRSWRPASASFDGSVISAIGLTHLDPQLMLVGTTKGGIFRSTDAGVTWTQNLASMDVPRRIITRILPHPHKKSVVAITVGAGGGPGIQLAHAGTRRSPTRPFSHVFLSTDCGSNWIDIDRGALPNVVFNTGAWETRKPFRLFVAGDAGVFVRQRRLWINIHGNVPNVVVSDLNYHAQDHILTAATYGRGLWRLDVSGDFEQHGKGVDSEETSVVGLIEDHNVAAPVLVRPREGKVFHHFPRNTEVSWRPVPAAVAYVVHVEALLCRSLWHGLLAQGTRNTELTFEFAGAQPGRWRVAALLPDSRRSLFSEWRTFSYTI